MAPPAWTPLTVLLTLEHEPWWAGMAEPDAWVEIRLRVQQGTWEETVRDAVPVSAMVSLFETVMARLTSLMQQRWLADHPPDPPRDA